MLARWFGLGFRVLWLSTALVGCDGGHQGDSQVRANDDRTSDPTPDDAGPLGPEPVEPDPPSEPEPVPPQKLPMVRVDFPVASSVFVEPMVTVRGVTSAEAKVVRVRVNGTEATSRDAFATWSAEVELRGTSDAIVASAEDGEGRVFETEAIRVSRAMIQPGMIRVAGDDAWVLDTRDDAVWRVDRRTGELHELASFRDRDPSEGSPRSLALDLERGRVLVLFVLGTLVGVDIESGEVTTITEPPPRVGEASAAFFSALVVDGSRGRALVVEKRDGRYFETNRVLAIDLETGQRDLLAELRASIRLSGRAAILSADATSLIVALGFDDRTELNVIELAHSEAAEPEVRRITTDLNRHEVHDMALDERGDLLLLTSIRSLRRDALTTLEVRRLPADALEGTEVRLMTPPLIDFTPVRSSRAQAGLAVVGETVWIAETLDRTVRRFSLGEDMGHGEVFSDYRTGAIEVSLGRSFGLATDLVSQRVFLAEPGGSLSVLDLVQGQVETRRPKLGSPQPGSRQNPILGLGYHRERSMLYYSQAGGRSVFALDPANGESTVLASLPEEEPSTIQAAALDQARSRFLISVPPSIFAVDLDDGTTSLFAELSETLEGDDEPPMLIDLAADGTGGIYAVVRRESGDSNRTSVLAFGREGGQPDEPNPDFWLPDVGAGAYAVAPDGAIGYVGYQSDSALLFGREELAKVRQRDDAPREPYFGPFGRPRSGRPMSYDVGTGLLVVVDGDDLKVADPTTSRTAVVGR